MPFISSTCRSELQVGRGSCHGTVLDTSACLGTQPTVVEQRCEAKRSRPSRRAHRRTYLREHRIEELVQNTLIHVYVCCCINVPCMPCALHAFSIPACIHQHITPGQSDDDQLKLHFGWVPRPAGSKHLRRACRQRKPAEGKASAAKLALHPCSLCACQRELCACQQC